MRPKIWILQGLSIHRNSGEACQGDQEAHEYSQSVRPDVQQDGQGVHLHWDLGLQFWMSLDSIALPGFRDVYRKKIAWILLKEHRHLST